MSEWSDFWRAFERKRAPETARIKRLAALCDWIRRTAPPPKATEALADIADTIAIGHAPPRPGTADPSYVAWLIERFGPTSKDSA